MKINYNESDQSIEIKDGSKTQYWIIISGTLFNIINAILFPVFILDTKQMEWLSFIWITIGLASLVLLIYLLLKKSASERLKLSEISSLSETQFFGRKMLSIKLNNGKLRDIVNMKNETQILDIKKFFRNMGIETN